MAGAAPSSPSGNGGKKPLDAAINLVPFIDLLSCCISFLLITAVWVQISWLQAQEVAATRTPPKEEFKFDKDKPLFRVLVCPQYYRFQVKKTDKVLREATVPMLPSGLPDEKTLNERLAEVTPLLTEEKPALLVSDKKISMLHFSQSLSLLQQAGFRVLEHPVPSEKECE